MQLVIFGADGCEMERQIQSNAIKDRTKLDQVGYKKYDKYGSKKENFVIWSEMRVRKNEQQVCFLQ